MPKTYRDQGAKGALLDEYEKANNELIELVKTINPDELIEIVDPHTQDLDCRSIQTILTHVVRAGHGYVYEFRKALGEQIPLPKKVLHENCDSYISDLNDIFKANLDFFEDYPDLNMAQFDHDKKFKVKWGEHYNFEQLFEHAIVHILRHRRQIERFLLKLKPS